MIEINLIPPALRKKRKVAAFSGFNLSLPPEALVGFVGGLVILLAFIHVLLLGLLWNKVVQKNRMEKSWQDILPQKQRADRLLNEWRRLQSQKSSIEKMTIERRILWAPKLNALSDGIPRGVWLNKAHLEGDILLIEGSVISKVADEMSSVGAFTTNLKIQKQFMSNLKNIEVGPLKRRKIQTAEIADFSITAKVQ